MSDQDALLLKRIAEQLGKAPFVSYDSEGHPVLLVLMTKDGTHIPEEVWACQSVQELRLVGFRLDQLPTDIAKLTQLRCLRIGSSTIGAFPSTMQALSQLDELVVDQGHLEDITALFSLPALRILQLKHCGLRQLPPEIGRLHRLEGLETSQNPSTYIPSTFGAVRKYK